MPPIWFAGIWRGRMHYAWIVLTVMFSATLAGVGVRAAPGIMIVPLQRAFGWDVALTVGLRADLLTRSKRGSPSSSNPPITDPAFCPCSGPLPQIASGDLDIAIVSQLPTPDLPLHDEFKPSSMEVIGFDAPFRCGRVSE